MKYEFNKENGIFRAEFHAFNNNFIIETDVCNCSYTFMILEIISGLSSVDYFYNLKTDKYTTDYTYNNELAVILAGHVSMGKDFDGEEVFVNPNSYNDSPLETDRAIRDFVESIKDTFIVNALLDK